jgi:hypothetical protein
MGGDKIKIFIRRKKNFKWFSEMKKNKKESKTKKLFKLFEIFKLILKHAEKVIET